MVIYLDQCAASYLATANKPSARWDDLREILQRGFSEGRLCCPMPVETFHESSSPVFGQENRIELELFFNAVGGGAMFSDFYSILRDEAIGIVRPNQPIMAYSSRAPKGWSARDDAAAVCYKRHKEHRNQMADRNSAHKSPLGAEQLSVWQIFDKTAEERSRIFLTDLERLRGGADGGFIYEWLTSWVTQNQLTSDEIELLIENVRNGIWRFTGVNFVDLLLGSRWEHDRLRRQRPNYDANDEIDRWRMSVALGYADICITDAYAAGLCDRSKITKFTSAAVYSVKDIEKLITKIGSV